MKNQIKVAGVWVDGIPELNEWCRQQVGAFKNGDPVWQEQRFVPTSATELLASAKTARIARVKVEAGERIKALDWQLSRAYRHSALGEPQKKAELAVLRQQQDIEEASDVAEAAIILLSTPEEVEAFTW